MNGLGRAIEVLDVRTSCGCTIANVPKKYVPPGEKVDIQVKLHTAGRTGPFVGRIFVRTNDKEFPSLSMKIEAEFKLYQGWMTAFPEKIVWEEILFGTPASRIVEIMRSGEDPLNFLRASCDVPQITITEAEEEPNDNKLKRIRLDILVSPTMPVGPFQANILVETDHSKYPQLEIPIKGEIVPDVKVTPRTLFINVASSGPVRRTILLESRSGKPFQIKQAVFAPRDFPMELMWSQISSSSWHISAHTNTARGKHVLRGDIIVNTDSKDTPSFVIPVTVVNLR